MSYPVLAPGRRGAPRAPVTGASGDPAKQLSRESARSNQLSPRTIWHHPKGRDYVAFPLTTFCSCCSSCSAECQKSPRQAARCLHRSVRPPLQIGNAVPTLPMYVLPVHWSVPHSLPFALSLVLSLAHAHNHTQTEVYIRPFEWDMILMITSYIRYMYVCMYYILTHIHTHIGTGGTHTPTAAT
jgi:hypothetical protein